MIYASWQALHHTSTNEFCGICHVHPQAEYSWKKSTHYKNESGGVVSCVECHLPPPGIDYITEKTRLGIRDAFGYVFKDTEEIDWEAKSALEHAVSYTYDASCIRCHEDLYSLDLSPKGVQAHEYYMEKIGTEEEGKLKCINCHITVGHFQPEPVEEIDYLAKETFDIPSYPPDTGEFVAYTDSISGAGVTFNMLPIPEGSFTIGSPDSEPYRKEDESPQAEIRLSAFWMGEIEVTWREFDAYYNETATMGKDDEGIPGYDEDGVDAVTGPTPPYGAADQGWGKGLRPAITMTHNTAMKYCEWLSEKTGKHYRLPTEAEWEYAARAGTTGPYFFEGSPKKLTSLSLINRLLGIDAAEISRYVWYETNSGNKTQFPYVNEPNPWGLYNMLGNVREFCSDWYAPDAYARYGSSIVTDPFGPESGTEHVVRGGSFVSDPANLRTAERDRTDHDAWLLTDPQIPKSVWWYSDSKNVGFRVVREYERE